MSGPVGDLEIAVVGLAGRFPGARTVDEFWRNLIGGVESIRTFTDEDLRHAGVSPAEYTAPHYVKRRAVLDDVDLFDAGFFGIFPRDAEILDPQQRLFLECAWHALEHAGHDPASFPGAIGVWAGTGAPHYLTRHLMADPSTTRSVHPYQLLIANDKDFVATRVAYKLNCTGPAVTVQTACSTSLVAVHHACQALLAYQCDMALAGGASILLPQRAGYLYQEGGIGSPDGYCRAFDADARGTVPGSGVGVVVLRRLADAIADGDHIEAVIKATAINNDGAHKVGFTAPSVEGQAGVIASAHALAGIDPRSIGYVEAHGTGTSMGDPIEIAALTQAFAEQTADTGFCAIGSVKTNIGHLDAAAGVTGLIKTVLALKHEQIPPSLHFTSPNPRIAFERTPFVVNAVLRDWARGAEPRRAGVSAFGVGGTNAHAVLEEAPVLGASDEGRPWQLVTWSARSASAATNMAADLAAHVAAHPDQPVADLAYTGHVGRRAFAHRRAVICRDLADLSAVLAGREGGRLLSGEAADERSVAFLFPGQGAQYIGMGQGLYHTEPTFRTAFDRCAEALRAPLGLDLRELLWRAALEVGGEESRSSLLQQTRLTQPAIFAVEYALARLLMSWGIQPSALVGHSIGEWVAACLAGMLSLEDALSLVAARGALMQKADPGAMLSVPFDEARARELVGDDLWLAAMNAPNLSVIAGTVPAIERLETRLASLGVAATRLRTSHAFHSGLMDSVLDAFLQQVAQVRFEKPAIPVVSNVTGQWLTADEALDPFYWVRQLREPVRFADGLATVAEGAGILLEVGPGRALTQMARQHAACAGRIGVQGMRSASDRRDDQAYAIEALGRVWLAGGPVDWHAFYAGQTRRRVVRPTYPFERQRYWVEPSPVASRASEEEHESARQPMARWLYEPTWERADAVAPAAGESAESWVVLGEASGWADPVVRALRARGDTVRLIGIADEWLEHDGMPVAFDPRNRDHYTRLVDALWRADPSAVPTRIAHVLNVGPERGDGDAVASFYSLLWLAQALRSVEAPVLTSVVTAAAFDVTGADPVRSGRARTVGVCRVAPQERPGWPWRLIDLPASADAAVDAKLVTRLVTELRAPATDAVVAFRAGHRWRQDVRAIAASEALAAPVRAEGVYLITGGLGRIGLTIARAFAERARARLVLVSRAVLPPRGEWGRLVATLDADDPRRSVLAQLTAIEALGASLTVCTADVSDARAMADIVAHVTETVGPLAGVVHAAGATGEAMRTIDELDLAACEAQFRSKVDGLRVVHGATAALPLDFRVAFSSLSAIVGGLGFAAYAAANAFMDAFAAETRGSSAPWRSINWDGWQFGPTDARGSALDAIEPAEGVEVFDRILALDDLSQVIVSTTDLAARRRRWVSRLLETGRAAAEAPGRDGRAARHARPSLAVAVVSPRDAVERRILEVWEEVLGMDGLGVDDDFFELGGHSLLATQLVSRVRDEYRAELPLRVLFETPTVAGLAHAVRERMTTAASTAAAMPSVPRDGVLPLSFAQRRLWFLDQLEPGSPLYNNPAAVELRGSLDEGALRRSLDAIAERHEVLRTTFAAQAGEPVLTLQPRLTIPLTLIDLRVLADEQRALRVSELAADEARRPFDLATGPLARLSLLRVESEVYIALITFHHIVSDGWSVNVFMRELVTMYQAMVDGRTVSLEPLPVQYVDYAAWQHRWLEGPEREAQLAYWRQQLGETPPLVSLPLDHPRPASQSFAGATRRYEIDADLKAALEALGRRHDATLFMTLAAGFAAVLARYSRETDITIGTPLAGRTRPEIERLVGCFVNTLVLRTDLSGDPTVAEMLARTRETALGAYGHQDVPFEAVVEALQPERRLSQTPFFQVMLVSLDAAAETLRFPGVAARVLDIDTGTAKFDLTLFVEERSNGLRLSVNYCTDLFAASTVDRFVRHLRAALAHMAAAPTTRLSALPLLDAEERAEVLALGHAGAALSPFTAAVHERIAARATFAPRRVAVESDHGSLTYGELDGRATQLARLLASRGVRPGVFVGLATDRSCDMIVGLLAILKSGAAVVALDPALPAERLALLIEDAGLAAVVTRASMVASLPLGSVPAVATDVAPIAEKLDRLLGEPDSAALPSVAAADAAYVIYTSGSTGTPKGVVVPHQAIAVHCDTVIAHYEYSADDRILQFASISFDAALEQILAPLVAGATMVLRGNDVWLAVDCHRRIAERAITIVNFPPAYWQQWIGECAGRTDLPAATHLRLAIVGGDAIVPETLASWRRMGLGHVRLLNAYGPTEATITATTYEMDVEDVSLGRLARAPIGRPLGARTAYVLDDHLELVPVGVAGELCLGGDSIATGYLHRPDLTAERFVPDPFGGPGQRMYRTGDLVSMGADGTIAFLGRVDHQVKIRGFRIEPGEVEAALRRHPAVADAVVVALADPRGDKHLVAYVLSEAAPSVAELRAHVARQLPEYMVPGAIVTLAAWPLTVSGKVDRRALPAPPSDERPEAAEYVAPQNPVEQAIADVWQSVLRVPRVGATDSFFALGGHSLLATQVVSRVREQFAVELSLRRLFETPTVRGLADEVSRQLAAQASTDELDILLSEIESLSDDAVSRHLAAAQLGLQQDSSQRDGE